MSCPKFIGLPDMMRALVPKARVVSVDFDLRREGFLASFIRLGRTLGESSSSAECAYLRAKSTRSPKPNDRSPVSAEQSPVGPLIGLLGHDYVLDDPYLGMNLAETLRRLGCRTLRAGDLSVALLEAQRDAFEPVSWFFEEEILCAASAMLRGRLVDGLIHVLSFGCGAGSITSELVEREIRNGGPVPLMRIVIDEQTGEAGLETRLESFADMLALRREPR